MTANINIQNKPVVPDQVKPVLKAVDHQSKDIKDGQVATRPVEPTKAEKTEDSSQANKTEKNTDDSEKALDSAVEQLNTYVQSINRNLEFNVDKDNGRTVVKVIDAETDELIRQIPNEEALHIAKQLDNGLSDNSDPGIFLIKERA